MSSVFLTVLLEASLSADKALILLSFVYFVILSEPVQIKFENY